MIAYGGQIRTVFTDMEGKGPRSSSTGQTDRLRRSLEEPTEIKLYTRCLQDPRNLSRRVPLKSRPSGAYVEVDSPGVFLLHSVPDTSDLERMLERAIRALRSVLGGRRPASSSSLGSKPTTDSGQQGTQSGPFRSAK